MTEEHQPLTKQKCVPCEGGTQPLEATDITAFLTHTPEWQALNNTAIRREFEFKDFITAIKFIDHVAELAESEGHHPDLYLHNWNKLTITLSTHAIGGLSQNDFILAAKIDELVHRS